MRNEQSNNYNTEIITLIITLMLLYALHRYYQANSTHANQNLSNNNQNDNTREDPLKNETALENLEEKSQTKADQIVLIQNIKSDTTPPQKIKL